MALSGPGNEVEPGAMLILEPLKVKLWLMKATGAISVAAGTVVVAGTVAVAAATDHKGTKYVHRSFVFVIPHHHQLRVLRTTLLIL